MNSSSGNADARLFVVVTTISTPTPAMKALASGCLAHGANFIVVGDRKTPWFELNGCRLIDFDSQGLLPWQTARLCATDHYSRKNIGYLEAISAGATILVETDDDNIPLESFWARRSLVWKVPCSSAAGWVNVYRYFCDDLVWPRGFPLDEIHNAVPPASKLPVLDVECPIQQGMADEDPDVDALHRLVLPGKIRFRMNGSLALGKGSWCPFNSQNTAWWPAAFPLLYLPGFCSPRLTDIWRSIVAHAISSCNGWHTLFHYPTVRQERNPHNLLRDFAEEVPGYLHNSSIAEALEGLGLRPGTDQIGPNLRRCYSKLVSMGLIDKQELTMLDAWLHDLLALGV